MAGPTIDLSKPLKLQFTAVDGRQVDLASLRGKVVLIDFWSSANPACQQNEFQIVRAYKKYNDQGFEVIGISEDKDKQTLLTFIQTAGMYWPQYFDGLGKHNLLATRWGVTSVPTMWLVNQKGLVVNTKVGDDLGAQVKKLLNLP